ncbi:hypothetical protein SH449x_000043 [Pirellulaceae bacterium SH449]
MTAAVFWERIQTTGLASRDGCRQWAKELETTLGKEGVADPLKIASALLRSGKLTPFQFACLSEAVPPTLVIGPYRLIETLSDQLGPNWFETEHAIDGQKRWCFQLRSNQLISDEIKAWPPSIELAKSHKAIEHTHLDRWETVIAGQGIIACFGVPVPGQPLSEIVRDRGMPAGDVLAIVEQMARALNSLHTNKLVHGNIDPDHVWIEDDRCILRRNILFVPRSPYLSNQKFYLNQRDELSWEGAAPEFLLPDAKPSPQTDLYALGILALHLLHGKSAWPQHGVLDAIGWKKVHSKEPPVFPDGLPERVKEILRGLLAKNPGVRFKSAEELLDRIQGATIPAGKNVPAKKESARFVETTSEKSNPPQKAAPRAESSSLAPKKTTPAPATPAPATPAPATPAPATPAPATPAPATPAPATPAPATPAPATPAPATPAPATPAPATPAPATPAPATPAPATPAPATPAPATPAPTATSSAQQVVTASDNVDVRKEKAPAPKKAIASPSKKSPAVKPQVIPVKRKKKKPVWFLPALAVGSMAFLGVLIAVLTRLGGGGATPEPVTVVTKIPSDTSSSSASSGIAGPSDVRQPVVDPVEEFFTVLPDDGRTLWAPPTAGPPYSLELLPPGLELFAGFSESIWFGNQIGPIQSWLLESLPEWKSLVASYPFVSEPQIKRVCLAAYPATGPDQSELVVRLELKNPVAIGELMGRYDNYRVQVIPGSMPELQCWSNGTLGIVFDGFAKELDRKVGTLTVGPIRLIHSFLETSGGVAPVRRQLESLIGASDSLADLFAVTTPSFLYGHGRGSYSMLPRMRDVLKAGLDDSVQALSFTASVRERLFGEMRFIGGDIAKYGAILTRVRESLDGLPNQLEAQYAAEPVAPYWRLIAARYPQMLRSIARNTRYGIEEGQIIANLYMPKEAVDNLTVGTWMALNGGAGGSSTGMQTMAAQPASSTTQPALSIESLLDRPMSLSFAQESLEMSLAAIATEFNDAIPSDSPRVEMMINGGAFQKEGITQNQQIRDFSFERKPLREVLTNLVRRANPVTTVQSPTEKDQKIVWVVLDNPDSPGSKKIELTTRVWAETNGVQLPKEFLP